ncbi:GNAT family N-acetyltransferase [Halosegnis longus]|uniref:GNAT family N-acetyltransferase n=1 Tax=Halosegnis longus TaxID=2216012 RepID=A0AAJ4R877_9EURY|nr:MULTISPECIES: GNAT family N-acetyltransferase [Halobacteriales]RNJ26278.1 GNAT family N-acetyltransferase [Salella cibi]
MELTTPTASALDALVELWLDLARDQRAHGSHLCVTANENQIRESLSQRLVVGGVRIARVDDEPVGFATFYPEQGVFEQEYDRGIIENLYVTAPHRGNGIGTALLEAAVDALREGGADRIALDVLAANERARSFYRDHGFEPHRVEMERRP